MLSYLYGTVMDVRNALYDRGVFQTLGLGARTISVGNLTTGGTGKTPLVAYVASSLADRGETVCILTRGYGRRDANKRVLVSDGENIIDDATLTGDEPLELALRLRDKAIIIADADRVSAGEWATRKFGVTAFVLDDGFQHRKARRDVDIVCIDATKPLNDLRLLPAGYLREALSGLGRADAIVITRADLVTANAVSDLRSEIARRNARANVFEVSTKLTGFKLLRNAPDDGQGPNDRKALAFCGLGEPENFFAMLRREGMDVAETMIFRDHYAYRSEDAAALEGAAKAAGCDVLVTTAKDAAKLAEVDFTLPCYIAEIDIALNDPDTFNAML